MDFSLFDTLFESIVILNEKSEIIYYNHNFSTFTKSSPRVIKNKKFLSQIIANEFLHNLCQKSFSTNSDLISKEEIISLEDATEYHVIVKTKNITVDNNKLIIVAFNDISIEKNLYTKYRYQIEELKDIHQQIVKADKLSTIGEITASISHEVSNPLTIASGTSELIASLMEEDDLNPQKDLLKSCITDVRDALLRIDNIIKGMKKFLHGNDDKKEYACIEQILEQSLKLLNSSIKKNLVSIQKNYLDNSQSLVYVNELKMEQLFINLIKNSMDAINTKKATNDKFQGEISISLDDSDFMYEITISDNGIGIPKDIQEKIFDSFFTTKDVGEGTGLGLAISSKIIESYQGNIELIPSEIGAAFKITIPKMKALNLANSTLLKENSANISKNILVIDDEVKILNIINETLSNKGHNTLCASNLEDALGLISESNIDLIICDYQFPETTGDQIILELKKLSPSTPVVYMTAKTNEVNVLKDIERHIAHDILEKPFTNEALISIISKWSSMKL